MASSRLRPLRPAALACASLVAITVPSGAGAQPWRPVPPQPAPSDPATAAPAAASGNPPVFLPVPASGLSTQQPPLWNDGTAQSPVPSPQWMLTPPGQELPVTTAVELAPTAGDAGGGAAPAQAVKRPGLPVPATYGGFRDLYRAGRWYPSISTIVPMGYGPQGLMAGFGFSGSDCRIESKNCSQSVTSKSIQKTGEAVIDSYVGFGDPSTAISVLVTQLTQDTIRSVNQQGSVFNGNQTGFAVTRNLGPSTAIKIGAEGLIRWGGARNLEADRPKSAFGVISHRIMLKPQPSDPLNDSIRWFSDLYLTVGAGNGEFRPLDKVISAQIQSAKDAGCWFTTCSALVTRDAYLKGTEWGTFYPIASIALAVTDQANLITEWTGRNLNLSLSWQPIRQWGWTITPGIGNLIRNSDYGNNVNIPACPQCDMGGAITTRPLLYLRSMINIKF